MRVCRADNCGTILAADNTGDYCSPCAVGRWDSPYWRGVDQLKGPELAEWLTHRLPHSDTTAGGVWTNALTRAVYRWRHETVIVDFATIEPYLIHLDLRPEDIPARCWTTRGRRHGGWPEGTKAAVLAQYAEGVPPVELRARHGVSLEAIHVWRRAAGLPLQDPAKSVNRKVAA